MTTGFLHPGAMGAALAASCNGPVAWASAGRSAHTVERATAAGLTDAGTVDALVDACDTIVSVCPPGVAPEVARSVSRAGFGGRYVDANAVAPATSRRMDTLFDDFVDGGIIGAPPAEPGRIRLYLAGPHAKEVAALWAGTPVETRVVEGSPGAASAVKVAYAGWTKGSAALLLSLRAYAEAEGVGPDLLAEWATSLPDLEAQSERAAVGAVPKAWRWVDEMHEIAAALRSAGLPGSFHDGAADVYAALAGFKDVEVPDLDAVLDSLVRSRS